MNKFTKELLTLNENELEDLANYVARKVEKLHWLSNKFPVVLNHASLYSMLYYLTKPEEFQEYFCCRELTEDQNLELWLKTANFNGHRYTDTFYNSLTLNMVVLKDYLVSLMKHSENFNNIYTSITPRETDRSCIDTFFISTGTFHFTYPEDGIGKALLMFIPSESTSDNRNENYLLTADEIHAFMINIDNVDSINSELESMNVSLKDDKDVYYANGIWLSVNDKNNLESGAHLVSLNTFDHPNENNYIGLHAGDDKVINELLETMKPYTRTGQTENLAKITYRKHLSKIKEFIKGIKNAANI